MFITSPQGYDIQAQEPIDSRLTKATLADRDAISIATRYEGLPVFVVSEGKTYQLIGGITNSDWSNPEGSNINLSGNLHDMVYYKSGGWDSVASPLYYLDPTTPVSAATAAALENLAINAVTNFNSAVVYDGGRSVSIAPHTTNEDPFAVFITGKTKPSFDVRDGNTIYGVNTSDIAIKLFENGELRSTKWQYGNNIIDLSTNATIALTNISKLNSELGITLSIADGFQALTLSSTAPDSGSKLHQLLLNPNIEITTDKSSIAYDGISVEPTITDLSKIKEFNAFNATIGNLNLVDGVVNLGAVTGNRGNSWLNVKDDGNKDYFLYLESLAGGILSYIDLDGELYSRSASILGGVTASKISAVNTSKGKISYSGNPVTEYAHLGNITINGSIPQVTWVLDYQYDSFTTSGRYVINARYKVGDDPQVNIVQSTVPGTFDSTGGTPELITVAIDTNTLGVYIRSEFINSTIYFTSDVYGPSSSALPAQATVYDSILPSGTQTAQVTSYENYWDLDVYGNITNINSGNVIIGNEKELILENYYKIIPTVGESSVSITWGDLDAIIQFIDNSGKVGWHTNSIVSGEDTTMAGITGITSLKRVGPSIGTTGQALFWNDAASKYLPAKNNAVTTVALNSIGDLDGTVYKKTLTLTGESNVTYRLVFTNPGGVTSGEVTLPTVTTKDSQVDCILVSSDEIPFSIIPNAGSTINGAGSHRLFSNVPIRLQYDTVNTNWVILDTKTLDVVSIESNTVLTIDAKQDTIYKVSNSAQVTLPDATEVPTSTRLTFINTDNSAVELLTPGTANPSASIDLFGVISSVTVISDGIDYLIFATSNLEDKETTISNATTTVEWDIALSSAAKLTMDTDHTLSIINSISGDTGLIRIVQDGTGGRVLTFPGNSINYGTVSIDTAPNSTTILSFYYDGTNFNWTSVTTTGLTYGIGDLVDVTATGASTGDALIYQAGVWVASDIDSANITFDNTGTAIVGTDVEAALVELDTRVTSIEDAGGGVPIAADVTYDNGTSGLTADDVQAAIDEIDAYTKAHIESTNVHTSAAEKATFLNPSVVEQAEAEARTSTISRLWTAERVGQAIAKGVQSVVRIKRPYQTLTSDTAITMDLVDGQNAVITLDHAATITMSGLTDGDEGNIVITQGSTGGTIAFSPTPKVIDGGIGDIILTVGVGAIDILSYTYDGTNLFMTYGPNFN